MTSDLADRFELLGQEMSEENVRQLQRAYRHPFEYINPRLYSLGDEDLVKASSGE